MKQAMLLAAGRGERLAPLTDRTPKPLLDVAGTSPLLRHVRRFAAAGYERLVVNVHHLGEQIQAALGNGSAFGIEIVYSPEPQLLNVAGGIRLAIERGLLTQPFAVANGDIVSLYDIQHLQLKPAECCRLVLVDNPPEKKAGDFSLDEGRLLSPGAVSYTYAGIGCYTPEMFAALPPSEPQALLPLLQEMIAAGCAGGEYYSGAWFDIGSRSRLVAARRYFSV